MLVLFIDDNYEIKENSWCHPYRDKTYPTISEAKRQCSDDPSCPMFFDRGGEGNKFYLCDDGAEIKISTTGALLYIKGSEYICICKPFCIASNHKMLNV